MKSEKEIAEYLKHLRAKALDYKEQLKELEKMDFIGKAKSYERTQKTLDLLNAKIDTLKFILNKP